MQSIRVTGGNPLSGTVTVGGAKNSGLKLMAAALLAPGVTTIHNMPDIADVDTMSEVIGGLGAPVRRDEHSLVIDATTVDSFEAPYEIVAKMRASIIVLGPLLGRLGRARVAMPGGCNIGSRKIDLHLRGLSQLGVQIASEHGYIEATAPHGMRGASIALDFPSVGATENLLMAGAAAWGTTVIENAAREPEIQDLIAFLNAMGARIEGAGTSTITIEGVSAFSPVTHGVVGDRIEAGTFLVAAALCGGPVTVAGVKPEHLDLVLAKLTAAGAEISTGPDEVTLQRGGPIRPVDAATLPYPGFPTDMQPQFMTLMAVANGTSVITENVFESRFMFADELGRMGADITIEGHRALVRGAARLSGAPVISPDLRGGAALVLAGLAAEGATTVGDIHHIMRGYESFVDKLAGLGADIALIDSDEGEGRGC
ncbi:MAG: UDP-N-acetylglucosamine 1-carboxyvinyltransferase [Actinomycetia bacterium]|nr:UDP-N-acetylglucosamine 1-carboxyvinyltransferase [Actinomycetes bacterium]